MLWNPLTTQFCLELAFGLCLAMAFVPRAPVGVLFYRIMGTSALALFMVAVLGPTLSGALPWNSPATLLASLGILAYPVYSGPYRGVRWGAGLGLALFGSVAALVMTLQSAGFERGALTLASLSALATGAVAGSVALAMVLGHWYLTVPNLALHHLSRLNLVTIVSMCASLTLIGISCLIFKEQVSNATPPLLGPRGLFHLGTRVTVGLVLPLVFAAMTASSLRFKNTRSATGILYASTVLVLIGLAVSISLQDSYGIPL